MNKKMSATLAVVSVLGATTAFAVNPFSDVTPNDWAYQAVSQLAAQGVIDGYPDGTFKGERNITRYEMAQMVARAIARQEMVDAEQQAQINRLANEFANELNSLGVRVDNLEKKIGNVKVTGDARMRWADQSDNDKFDMRARLQFNANVAKNTKAVARISTGNFGFNSDKDANLELDRLYVSHKANDFYLTGGRYGEKFGETGYWYDDAIDGAKAGFKTGDFVATVGYGTFRGVQLGKYAFDQSLVEPQKAVADATANVVAAEADQEAAQAKLKDATAKADAAAKAQADAQTAYDAVKDKGDDDPEVKAAKAKLEEATAAALAANNEKTEAGTKVSEANTALNNAHGAFDKAKKTLEEAMAKKDEFVGNKGMDAAYGILGYTGKNFHLLGSYISPNGENVKADSLDSIWGVGGALIANDKIKLSGDYFQVKGKDNRKNADFWVARVDFGQANMKKPGTWNLFVDYVDAEKYSYLGGSGALRTSSLLEDTKSWGVGAGIVVAENVKLEAFRSFNAETQDGKDIDDLTKVQVVYKF